MLTNNVSSHAHVRCSDKRSTGVRSLMQVLALGLAANVGSAWAVECYRSESDWSEFVAYPKTIKFDEHADGTILTTQYAPDVTFSPLEGGPVAVEAFGPVLVSPNNGIHIGGPDSPWYGGDASIEFGDGLEGVGIWYSDSETEDNAIVVYTKAGPNAPEVETKEFRFENAEYQNRFLGCVTTNPTETISRIELRTADWDRIVYDNLRYAKPCRHAASPTAQS